jgi:hypothetical protein
MKLDLGSGPRPKAGYLGVDRIAGLTDYCVDLTSGVHWPWELNSVEALRASHVIEHIAADELQYWTGNHDRKVDRLFWFFEQAFYVARPGAEFELEWPNPDHALAKGDPTHRRFLSLEFLQYLSKAGRELAGVGFYNVLCDWRVEATWHVRSGPKLEDVFAFRALLRKPQ